MKLVMPALAPWTLAAANATKSAAISAEDTPVSEGLDEELQAGLDSGLTGVALAVEQDGEVASTARPGSPTASTDTAGADRPVPHLQHHQDLHRGPRPATGRRGRALAGRHGRRVARRPGRRAHPATSTGSRSANCSPTPAASTTTSTDDSPFWQDAYLGEEADWSRVWTPEELLAYADGANACALLRPGRGRALLQHRLHPARADRRGGDRPSALPIGCTSRSSIPWG